MALPKIRFGKKGLSPVVATILIVAVTVAAATIIAKFIIPFVSKNLDRSSECVDFSDYFYFKEGLGYNCYKPIRDENNEVINRLYALSIGARGDREDMNESVKGFRLSFANEEASKAISVEGGEDTNGEDGHVRMLDEDLEKIGMPGVGEVLTYVYNTKNIFDSVSIHPILRNGRICDKSDVISVRGEICEKDL